MRSDSPMSLAQVREAAPAVFQTNPHRRTSERYTPIKTIDVLQGMLDAGYGISKAQQKHTRTSEAMLYTRHVVCLRPLHSFTEARPGGVVPEVVVVNGHDGLTSYQVFAGLYRFVCANGLMVGQTMDTFAITHRGDIVQQVLDASKKVWELLPKIDTWIDKAENTTLDRPVQLEYAARAMEIRYDNERPFEPAELLTVRRDPDAGDNVWRIYNRVQENLMQGGIQGRSATGRRVMSRPIARVTRDVEYNRKLWDLTTEYLEAA